MSLATVNLPMSKATLVTTFDHGADCRGHTLVPWRASSVFLGSRALRFGARQFSRLENRGRGVTIDHTITSSLHRCVGSQTFDLLRCLP
jgi:hypothetical protein